MDAIMQKVARGLTPDLSQWLASIARQEGESTLTALAVRDMGSTRRITGPDYRPALKAYHAKLAAHDTNLDQPTDSTMTPEEYEAQQLRQLERLQEIVILEVDSGGAKGADTRDDTAMLCSCTDLFFKEYHFAPEKSVIAVAAIAKELQHVLVIECAWPMTPGLQCAAATARPLPPRAARGHTRAQGLAPHITTHAHPPPTPTHTLTPPSPPLTPPLPRVRLNKIHAQAVRDGGGCTQSEGVVNFAQTSDGKLQATSATFATMKLSTSREVIRAFETKATTAVIMCVGVQAPPEFKSLGHGMSGGVAMWLPYPEAKILIDRLKNAEDKVRPRPPPPALPPSRSAPRTAPPTACAPCRSRSRRC